MNEELTVQQIRRNEFRKRIARNISTMTQLEIEQAWSDTNYKIETKVSQDMLLSELDDKFFDRARKAILVDDIDELLESLIMYCWIPQNQMIRDEKMYIDPSELVVFLAKSKAFDNTGIPPMLSTQSMMNFVMALNEILFDWETVTIKFGGGVEDFRTKTYMRIGFVKELVESDFIFSTDFPLPIIGEPLDWISGVKGGGYLLSQDKPTLKLGEASQPQNVLDVLNTMQKQKFRFVDDDTVLKYREFIYASQAKKLGLTKEEALASPKIKEIADNTTSTLQLHMDLLNRKEFSFQWKFDFRGRIYNTGYNLHLQSDKFKKAMLLPSPQNFDKTYALAEKLSN